MSGKTYAKAMLIKDVPKERLVLISGTGDWVPKIGDVGETDQCFQDTKGRAMVDVYFFGPDGDTEWQIAAYESELKPTE